MRRFIAGAVLMLTAACGSSTPTTPTPPASPLTGTWLETSFNGVSVAVPSLEFKLVQATTSITGTYDHIPGTVPPNIFPDLGTVSGTFSESAVNFSMVSGTGLCPSTISGTLSGNRISGNWTSPTVVIGFGCGGPPVSGTFVLTKQAQ